MTNNRNLEPMLLIQELTDACELSGVKAWLLGGWGIEALCGTIRRTHYDIDLLVSASDRKLYRQLVALIGAAIHEDAPQKLRFIKNGIQVDTRFFYALPDGRLVSDLDADDPMVYPWPRDSFPEQFNGELNGNPIRAISWSAQFVAKAGYSAFKKDVSLREKDKSDLEFIRKHLSVSAIEELENCFPGIPKDMKTTQQAHAADAEEPRR